MKKQFITPDRIVARVLVKGTHQRSLFGIPPTGRVIEIRQINVENVKKQQNHRALADFGRIKDGEAIGTDAVGLGLMEESNAKKRLGSWLAIQYNLY